MAQIIIENTLTATNNKSGEIKKTIFSGAQPSGKFTLGNYLGAINNWSKLQDEYNCLYCIVDLHAITVRHDPAVLRKQSRAALIEYIACGLDPEKNILFIQSNVPAHAELAWVLNCYTYMGELSRMTQYKDKSQKHTDNINTGLFAYPVLMAADILLYQTDLVPIGKDQKQHLELARDIAQRFNGLYGDFFTIPEGYFGKQGSKIMSLQEPSKKMSKSDENLNNVVFLSDEPNVIMNKIKRAVTDSGSEIFFSDDKPGVSNLLSIYSCVTGKTIADCEKEFVGFGYGKFKQSVGEAVVDALKPIQDSVKKLSAEKTYIDNIIKVNAEKANRLANKTLSKVYRKVGLL